MNKHVKVAESHRIYQLMPQKNDIVLMAVVENQRSLLTESSLCKDHCFESLPSNGFAVVRNQDRSHSASHLTLSTKEAKLPLFNDSPLPAAQEELCISLNYSGP